MTERPDVMARVVISHQPSAMNYHEWITLGERVRCNRLMIPNRRMYLTTATKWICNGPECPAFAFVSDAFIERILRVLGPLPDDPARPPVDPAQGVERVITEALGNLDHSERTASGPPAAGELPPSAAPDAVPGGLGR